MQASTQEFRKKIEEYSYSPNDQLGAGYSSIVYRGLHDCSQEAVAIKVINLKKLSESALPDLLKAEINILQSLSHKNILRCYNVFITVNNCYIMTQFCNEGDLATLLLKTGRMEEVKAIQMFKEICEGYKYLRDRNIIHRDIKPANILLKGGVPKIGDFGFAKQVNKQEKKQKYRIGSPLYMSPKALFDTQYSHKNDIWALGVLFYEMIQGRAPWNVRSEKQLRQAIKTEVRFSVMVREQLQKIIKGCLAYEEQERMDIDEILQELNKLREGVSISEFTPQDIPLIDKKETNRSISLMKTPVGMDFKRDNNSLPKQLDIQKNKQNKSTENKDILLGTKNQSNGRMTLERRIIAPPETLDQALKTNYRILKWLVNYCRYIYKLFPKIEKDIKHIENHEKSAIFEFMANILRNVITKLNAIDRLSSHFAYMGIKNYEQFKTTEWSDKISSVTKQYYQKYLQFLQKFNFSYKAQIKLQNRFKPSLQLIKALQKLPISNESGSPHNISVDLLISLVVTNELIDKEGISKLINMVNYEIIIETTPSFLQADHIAQLNEKRGQVVQMLRESTLI